MTKQEFIEYADNLDWVWIDTEHEISFSFPRVEFHKLFVSGNSAGIEFTPKLNKNKKKLMLYYGGYGVKESVWLAVSTDVADVVLVSLMHGKDLRSSLDRTEHEEFNSWAYRWTNKQWRRISLEDESLQLQFEMVVATKTLTGGKYVT